MPEYYVEWRIELSADSPEEAARKARELQRDDTARVGTFHVIEANHDHLDPYIVDLNALDESAE